MISLSLLSLSTPLHCPSPSPCSCLGRGRLPGSLLPAVGAQWHFNYDFSFLLTVTIFPLNKIPSLPCHHGAALPALLKGQHPSVLLSPHGQTLPTFGSPNRALSQMCPLSEALPCSGRPSGSPGRDVAGCVWGRRWPRVSTAGRCSSAGWQRASPRRAPGSRTRRWQSLLQRKQGH